MKESSTSSASKSRQLQPKSTAIYDPLEYREATSELDKIIMHLQEPKRFLLDTGLENYLVQLRYAFTILNAHMSVERAVDALLLFDTNLTRYTAMKVVSDAQILWGDAIALDKRLQRAIMRDKFMKMYELAETKDNLEEMRKNLEAIVKMDNLNTPDAEDPDDDFHFPIPKFSSDAKLLDIDHEEIK